VAGRDCGNLANLWRLLILPGRTEDSVGTFHADAIRCLTLDFTPHKAGMCNIEHTSVQYCTDTQIDP
jgi:hypothetical protein